MKLSSLTRSQAWLSPLTASLRLDLSWGKARCWVKFLVVLDHSPGLTVLQHSLADSADGLAVTGHTPSEERAVATQMTGDSLLTQHQLLVIRADLTPEQYCVISHPNLTPHTSHLTCIWREFWAVVWRPEQRSRGWLCGARGCEPSPARRSGREKESQCRQDSQTFLLGDNSHCPHYHSWPPRQYPGQRSEVRTEEREDLCVFWMEETAN